MPLVGFRGALRFGDRGSVPQGRSGDGGAVLGSAETRAPSQGWRRARRKRHGAGRCRYRPDRISRRQPWRTRRPQPRSAHFTRAARMAARRIEGGPAAAPSLRPSGCRAPGRVRRARSPGRALPFLPGPSKIRRCASPARIAASAVGSTPLGCRSSCCPKTERTPRPVPSFRRHKRGDNQIDRTRVLEVRIQSPPAESRANPWFLSGGAQRAPRGHVTETG